MILVVVAVLLLLLTTGLLFAAWKISHRSTGDLVTVEPDPLEHPAPKPEEAPEPLNLIEEAGQLLSWNDLVFKRLKAHYPDLDGSINDYLYRFQQDNQ